MEDEVKDDPQGSGAPEGSGDQEESGSGDEEEGGSGDGVTEMGTTMSCEEYDCVNGGSCYMDEMMSKPMCHCPLGFEGQMCESGQFYFHCLKTLDTIGNCQDLILYCV